jgi:hypothetical protein
MKTVAANFSQCPPGFISFSNNFVSSRCLFLRIVETLGGCYDVS